MAEEIVRPAVAADWPKLNDIYNHYVTSTPITFDVHPFTLADRRPWFQQFATTGPYRLLAVENDGEVVGYSASLPFRSKPAYLSSIEATLYLEPASMGRGLGTALYTALFDALRDEDLHRAYAGITLPNAASLALHRRFGFAEVGVYREVDRKLGRYWDVQWFEKRLD